MKPFLVFHELSVAQICWSALPDPHHKDGGDSLRVDDPDGDRLLSLPVGVRDGFGSDVVSFTQHGSILMGLSAKEDVVNCLQVSNVGVWVTVIKEGLLSWCYQMPGY
ncbi:hypothetical protein PILCRDRAFT_2713 [Piloderma croceum F 1598]|uniref:Uncharacterized protein n=1 Tax=Piloderma croceum (strain F 1598) TaxID=765440 RepID=A0A0C3GFV9_PILCF|nr:hypothetical protein PILCRDRAFT_2713 [Piloderma croceum F 1598]